MEYIHVAIVSTETWLSNILQKQKGVGWGGKKRMMTWPEDNGKWRAWGKDGVSSGCKSTAGLRAELIVKKPKTELYPAGQQTTTPHPPDFEEKR